MLRKVGGLAPDVPGNWAAVFVTLTYPAEFPDARATKRHIKLLGQRAGREFGREMAWIWKLEPQPKRMAPHFHLLLLVEDGELKDTQNKGYRKGWMAQLRRWLSAAWYDICKTGDEKHLWAGVQAAWPKSEARVMAYMGKYVGKAVDEGDELAWYEPGRWWGSHHGRVIGDLTEGKVYALTREQFLYIRRLLRRHAPDAVQRSAAARGVRTWWSFDRVGLNGGLTVLDRVLYYLGVLHWDFDVPGGFQ